ncbi:hypothetical protein ABZV81_29435 [Streptomyces parvus]|uniref:hypothetical protein n=1 Tax=Streptomyces parvus TaxID=66428 RepID=UPI0033BCFB81
MADRPDIRRCCPARIFVGGVAAAARAALSCSWTDAAEATDRRWAGGTPLNGEDGVPVAVLAPESALVNGEAFRLLAGMLLLFLTVKDQQRFDRNTRRRRKVPIDGWRMAYIEIPAPKPAEKAAPKAAAPRCRRAGSPCTCPEPDLSVTKAGGTCF